MQADAAHTACEQMQRTQHASRCSVHSVRADAACTACEQMQRTQQADLERCHLLASLLLEVLSKGGCVINGLVRDNSSCHDLAILLIRAAKGNSLGHLGVRHQDAIHLQMYNNDIMNKCFWSLCK